MEIPRSPYTKPIKKYLSQAISDQYTVDIDEIVERISVTLVTKKDAENFLKLLSELYNAGHANAMDAAQKSLEAHGLKMKLVPPQEN